MTDSANAPSPPNAAPPAGVVDRVTSLDAIRGIAILGILPMNALVFGLNPAAYNNLTADGLDTVLDGIVGVLALLFIDQKMMALFSLLFGVGVIIFVERAEAKGRRAVWLSLWRFAILLAVGIVHAQFWGGDILAFYALCAPLVLLLRKLPAAILAVAGVALALAGSVAAPFVQATVSADGAELGSLWLADGDAASSTVFLWYGFSTLGRILGLMLIGVALYRWGIVQGDRSPSFYRKLALLGLLLGTSVTAVGIVMRIAAEWSPEVALVGRIPTDVGTIPMALGYLALIVLWNRAGGRQVERFRNVGRMALSNYLSQTALGLITLGWLLAEADLGRSGIALWVLGVWLLQWWWSTAWLTRFRYGPFEWAWRCATYRRWQPLRR